MGAIMRRIVRLTRRSYLVLITSYLLCAGWTAQLYAASPGVERIGPLTTPAASAAVKSALEDKGYRVTLDDGWTAEFWFSGKLVTVTKDSPGALYPKLANGEFVGVVNYPKGATDYRGQAIPAGYYALRYQYLPQDANHMGVSSNPDFVLAIPIAADADPGENLAFQPLVKLSAKATGTAHPAVIALATAGDSGSIVTSEGLSVFTAGIPSTGSSSTERVGIVVKGQATQ